MKAKIYLVYYDDERVAKRVMHSLFDVGVQRDAMTLITGQVPDTIFLEPEVVIPDDQRAEFQRKLDQGGALIAAWVMHFWKKRANGVLDATPPQAFETIKGTRFEGLFTRT